MSADKVQMSENKEVYVEHDALRFGEKTVRTMRAAAEVFFTKGLPVVPVRKKRPLVRWQRWQTERQTKEEFDGLPFDKADGFALVCGAKAANGRYFLAVDVDTAEFDLRLLPITQMERTPRGGLHFHYLSRENAKGEKHHALKLELLGLGNIVVVAPTIGYRKFNDNSPREIQSLKACFEKVVVKLGGTLKREPTASAQATALPARVKRLSCKEEEGIVRFLCRYWRHGTRNHLEMSFLGFCLKRGVAIESARRIVEEVVRRTGDNDGTTRLELVDYHYQNRLTTRLKGLSGIREIVREVKSDGAWQRTGEN